MASFERSMRRRQEREEVKEAERAEREGPRAVALDAGLAQELCKYAAMYCAQLLKQEDEFFEDPFNHPCWVVAELLAQHPAMQYVLPQPEEEPVSEPTKPLIFLPEGATSA